MGADEYGWQSKVYDRVIEPLNAPLRVKARALLPAKPGAVVLDVGCGTGTALAEYEEAGCVVLGTDPSAAMLAQAQQRLGDNADLRPKTGEEVPFPDGCADVVLLSLVLHSLRRDEAARLLTECSRVLRPSGRLLVTDFGASGLRFPRGWSARLLTVFAELAAGPTHVKNSDAYLRRGGLPGLLTSDWELEAAKNVAGGNVTISVLRPRV